MIALGYSLSGLEQINSYRLFRSVGWFLVFILTYCISYFYNLLLRLVQRAKLRRGGSFLLGCAGVVVTHRKMLPLVVATNCVVFSAPLMGQKVER